MVSRALVARPSPTHLFGGQNILKDVVSEVEACGGLPLGAVLEKLVEVFPVALRVVLSALEVLPTQETLHLVWTVQSPEWSVGMEERGLPCKENHNVEQVFPVGPDSVARHKAGEVKMRSCSI